MAKKSTGVSISEENYEHLEQAVEQLAYMKTNRSEIIDALITREITERTFSTGNLKDDAKEDIEKSIIDHRTRD